MSYELTALACAVALTIVQLFVAIVGALGQKGLPWAAGNRDGAVEFEGWGGRAVRAHHNMLENLPLFAAAVLIAHVAGRENATTHLGAQLFIWGRLAYAVIYVAGVPWLRTAAFAVGLTGIGLVLAQLF